MAQEVHLMGATYSDVPSISLPDSNGDYHSFVDATTVASSWTKVAETTYTISTSSTSTITVSNWDTGSTDIYTNAKMVYVRIRDTAGKRAGYFLGSDNFYVGTGISNIGVGKVVFAYNASSEFVEYSYSGTGGYGVYATYLNSDGSIYIRAKCHSTYAPTIDGTYKVEVYTLDYPDGVSPFA